jgi:hypothetical protein
LSGYSALNCADYPTKLPNIGRLRHPRYPPRPEGRGLPRNLIKVDVFVFDCVHGYFLLGYFAKV